MKAIVFQDGNPVELNVELNTNREVALFLNNLVSDGYISGFLVSMQKESEK